MIYHTEPDCAFYLGDVRECLAAMPEKSVQAVITSPPYFGLRRYSGVEPTVWGGASDCAHDWQPSRYYTEKSASAVTSEAFSEAGGANADRLRAARWREDSTCACCGAWLGCLGLESTPALFIAHLLDVFRAVKRVLRDDGVCFANLGDSYCAGTSSGRKPSLNVQHGYWENGGSMGDARVNAPGIPPKNLLLIPQRFAIAMQDDGWIVRSMIVWAKKSCMPESVTDRPTSAHEVIWMFTKRERYFWDAEAVREQALQPVGEPMLTAQHKQGQLQELSASTLGTNQGAASRNLRNVWLDPDDRGSDFWHLGPEPFKDAHFATFPTAIPRRCILAATSEAGCCSACGKPWERIAERISTARTFPGNGLGWDERKESGRGGSGGYVNTDTLGFRPSCQCSAPARPCVVLDPFGGSGTTQVVARELGRHSLYVDASREYADMAIKRYDATPVALPLHQPAPVAEQLALEER